MSIGAAKPSCLTFSPNPYTPGCPDIQPSPAMQGILLGVHRAAVRHKLRVNLRVLAEVQTLLWLPAMLLAAWAAWALMGLIVRVMMLPLEDSKQSSAVMPAGRSVQGI